ncbi:MAG TPA: ATP-binding protein [Candidatus Limnocylindrales bacterium]|nr:ATP-binding protein [Candidatus Limnocylindrales bacterium]
MVELESVGLFQGLNAGEWQSLRRMAQERHFATGREIFREGDPGDGAYVVRDGLVEIAHFVDGKEHRVFSQLGPGEIFGEMAVIENLPRSATAIAARDARVYFIPRDAMLALLKCSPGLAFNLLSEISRRLRDFNQLHLREVIQAERLAVVGNFARSILHDLKNPLTIISLAVETLDRPNPAPEKQTQSLNYIRNQVQHINEMIGDILEFTQGAATRTALAPVDYHRFINELLPELNADAEVKSVRIELQNEPPSVRLRLDARRLRRVFFNLLHNATDAMPAGGKIFLRFQRDEKEVITELEDTGPGLAPEIADRLFQPFATHGKAHGTGLGLSICKKTVEDHGGRMEARSEPGHGAIFSFALPLAKDVAGLKE